MSKLGVFMNYYDIFFDIIENFFDFLIIDLFIKNHGYKSYYKHILRPIFLTFRIFYAIITFPNWFVYILNIIILSHNGEKVNYKSKNHIKSQRQSLQKEQPSL